jgi:hypothetical protein
MSANTPVPAVPELQKGGDTAAIVSLEETTFESRIPVLDEKASGEPEITAPEMSSDTPTADVSETPATATSKSAIPASTDVLIVGAGPVGMAAAISLRVSGVENVTIIDARSGGTTLSRAVVIHARTMEVRERYNWICVALMEG